METDNTSTRCPNTYRIGDKGAVTMTVQAAAGENAPVAEAAGRMCMGRMCIPCNREQEEEENEKKGHSSNNS